METDKYDVRCCRYGTRTMILGDRLFTLEPHIAIQVSYILVPNFNIMICQRHVSSSYLEIVI